MVEREASIGSKSRRVESAQTGPHPDTIKRVQRHIDNLFRRPIAEHSRRAFEQIAAEVSRRSQPVMLDTGCGTAHSSCRLASDHPDHFIIGIDKSAHRLERTPSFLPENVAIVRADLTDFLRLAAEAQWPVSTQYFLYPNPWPKKAHLSRRWHGSPVFPAIIALGGRLELRTNWRVYAEEFALALNLYGVASSVETFTPEKDYLTPFEKKYALSGHGLFRLVAKLGAGLRA